MEQSSSCWIRSLLIYWDNRVRFMFALGFSSGLPLLLVFGTLSFWLREASVSRSDIGYFSWILLAYASKWMWAPVIDRLSLPLLTRWLGRRRSWMLVSQLGIIAALCAMALSDPKNHLDFFAWCAVVVAFASATQDTVIDAFRIESGVEKIQAAMTTGYLMGYRLAMLLAGAGVLSIAAFAGNDSGYNLYGWQMAYFVMAGCMLLGVLTTMIAKEPKVDRNELEGQDFVVYRQLRKQGYSKRGAICLAWLYNAIYQPFADFFLRYSWHAVVILALIATYRISDVVMGVMAAPFYVDIGFSKEQVAVVSKVYGVIMTLTGAAIGGVLINRFTTLRILMLGAVLSAVTNLLYIWLSYSGPQVSILTLVISADNLSAGIATVAFITYLSSLTSKAFTATQYALFSSTMLLLPKFMGGFSGVFVDHFGYNRFFETTVWIGVPVVLLILLLERLKPEDRCPDARQQVEQTNHENS